MAFYIKYRPKKVADIDLSDARQILEKILRSADFPHAILLAGPRGIGKTSTARIIAKSLNCLEKRSDQIDPCNHCSACLDIDKGNFLDVLEIDAASNRGIDDIRQLKEGIGLAPVRGKKKVYIIDEVHMLTNEAFNALLKTLEEPPKNVIFLLCTTNPEKIPETVLSRCLRIDFHKASHDEVVRALKRVVKKENLIITEEALLSIAKNVDGSFRDGQKILEELALSGKKIFLPAVNDLFGKKSATDPGQLLAILASGDLSRALAEIDRLETIGVDWLFYTKQTLEKLRAYLHGVWKMSNGEKSDFSEEQLRLWTEIFLSKVEEIKLSPLPVLVMELLVGEIIMFSGNKQARGGGEEGGSGSKEPILVKTVSAVDEKESILPENDQSQPVQKSTTVGEISDQQWQTLLEKIKPRNHSLEAFLKSAQPISLENNKLTIGVYYQLHKECLEKETNRRIVETVAGQILDCPVRLFCRLVKKPPQEKTKTNRQAEKDITYDMAKDIFGGDKNG
jgi:DNA polymerase-3 subunit gamma/tau